MTVISDNDHVVRVIFPESLRKDGTLHPSAFRLREWPMPKGPERYISVNHYESKAFASDLESFDKGRNLSCSKMSVGEIRHLSLFLDKTENYPVNYDVRDTDTVEHPSHAGIFITIGSLPLEGHGDILLDTIEEGKNKSKNILAIRRVLADLASKTLTTVDDLLLNNHQL